MRVEQSHRADGLVGEVVAAGYGYSSLISQYNTWRTTNQSKRIVQFIIQPYTYETVTASAVYTTTFTSATAADLKIAYDAWRTANPNTVVQRTNVTVAGALGALQFDMVVEYLVSTPVMSYVLWVWYDTNESEK